MFTIDLRSRVPIYEQLVENIKDLIFKGVLKADDKLPSVRDLASKLTINPNTIQKAYRILEQEGFIYSVRGRGNYIMKLEKPLLYMKKTNLFNELNKILEEAYYLNISKEELIDLISNSYKSREVNS
jgi:GntR family transcriptional regulator